MVGKENSFGSCFYGDYYCQTGKRKVNSIMATVIIAMMSINCFFFFTPSGTLVFLRLIQLLSLKKVLEKKEVRTLLTTKA